MRTRVLHFHGRVKILTFLPLKFQKIDLRLLMIVGMNAIIAFMGDTYDKSKVKDSKISETRFRRMNLFLEFADSWTKEKKERVSHYLVISEKWNLTFNMELWILAEKCILNFGTHNSFGKRCKFFKGF